MLSINEMTDLDYAILEKLAQSAMLESVLLNTFPQPAVAKHRLNLLMHSEYEDLSPWGGMPTPRPDSYYVQESASKLELSPHGWKTLEDWHLQKKKEHRKLVEWRITKYAPIIISIIALIVAIISLLQSLHWIHLEQSEILPVLHNYMDPPNSTSAPIATQPLQSP